MGNSRAYPVFRTTDATAAYTQAMRLCALLAECEDEVGLMAELETVEDLRKMAAVLPGATFHYVGVRTGSNGHSGWFDLDVATTEDVVLEAHLPLYTLEDAARGSAEERFVAALGQGTAAIGWHGLWPDDPEADQYGIAKYDGVQVVFHGDDAQWGRWTEHHTVFVHVDKWGDLPRAEKLAAHIGGEVLGEEQLGW
ncbi:hypothetical protein ACFYYB_17865 [Streptomyces sp. NPDC002886]|uniref:hypothetical protein n=1 Tax=Streptomyces sp. NPDC002886 TaxID=3364667 RepID=UPI0036BD4075